MNEFEYIGGNIWTILGTDEDGYEYSIISVEIEKGKRPFIISYVEGEVTKEMIDKMLELVYKEMI